jgi:RNA recognition motif-containing protein
MTLIGESSIVSYLIKWKGAIVRIMSTKTIYVGNLEWNTTEDELKEFFSTQGNVVSVQIIKDRDTGRSRGFGFVEMENADEAITALNNKELRGRNLKLNPARERKSFNSRGM